MSNKVRNKKDKSKKKSSRYANTVSLRDDNGDIFYVTESEYERIKNKKEEEKELQRLEQEYLQQVEKEDSDQEVDNDSIVDSVKKYFNNIKIKIVH